MLRFFLLTMYTRMGSLSKLFRKPLYQYSSRRMRLIRGFQERSNEKSDTNSNLVPPRLVWRFGMGGMLHGIVGRCLPLRTKAGCSKRGGLTEEGTTVASQSRRSSP